MIIRNRVGNVDFDEAKGFASIRYICIFRQLDHTRLLHKEINDQSSEDDVTR